MVHQLNNAREGPTPGSERLSRLLRHLAGSATPAPPVGTVRVTSDGQLLVCWSGYHHAQCWWGLCNGAPAEPSASRDAGLDRGCGAPAAAAAQLGRLLFNGFTDGAANVMLVDDPTGGTASRATSHTESRAVVHSTLSCTHSVYTALNCRGAPL